MTTLAEKLNMDINEEITSEKGVTFCARNMVEVFSCKTGYIEEALNDAGYYEEDGDYTESDLVSLVEIVNEFGSQQMNYNQAFEKQIWFDENDK